MHSLTKEKVGCREIFLIAFAQRLEKVIISNCKPFAKKC